MMPSSVHLPNMNYIRRKDPRMYETLRTVQRYLPAAIQSPPPPVSNVSVVSNGDGTVDVTFEDGDGVNQAVNYFVEHAADGNFFKPRVEFFGPSRSGSVRVGGTARAWRVFSQYSYPPSQPSAPVIFGGATATLVGGEELHRARRTAPAAERPQRQGSKAARDLGRIACGRPPERSASDHP